MDYRVIGVLSWKHDLCSEVTTYFCSHSLQTLIIDILFVLVRPVTDHGPESSPISCMDFTLVLSCVISHLQADRSSGPQVLVSIPHLGTAPGLVRRHSFCKMDTTSTLQASVYITDTENTIHALRHLTK